MFDKLKKYIVAGEVNSIDEGNCFYPVKDGAIAAAEKKLGFEMPSQLRQFYNEVGYGFLVQSEDGRNTTSAINRFVDPLSVARLYLGEDEYVPFEGFEKGSLPFFEIADQIYLVMHPFSEKQDAVYYASGEMVSNTLNDFIEGLLTDPEFYER